MSAGKYCKAIFWGKLGRKRYPLLPLQAFTYLAILLLSALVVLAATELFVGHTQKSGILSTEAWEEEDKVINHNNQAKVKMRGSVWTSAGIPYPKEKGMGKRILVIGDSFVWGDGYANANDIWWRQLDRELKRRGYWQVEVVAAGASGASTLDQLWWLRNDQHLKALAPDAIIIGYASNDPDVKLVVPPNTQRDLDS